MASRIIVLEGVIASGFDAGACFMSMNHYKKEIKKKLGFDAYPGTLNIKIGEKQMALLKSIPLIEIRGYKLGIKKFGGASCYKAKIKNINGSIIVPELTKHSDIIEFIAPVHVKSELMIRDGEKIKIEMI